MNFVQTKCHESQFLGALCQSRHLDDTNKCFFDTLGYALGFQIPYIPPMRNIHVHVTIINMVYICSIIITFRLLFIVNYESVSKPFY